MSTDEPTVIVEPGGSDSIGPECPVVGCERLFFNPHRMQDHLDDDHELSDILLRGRVVIND
jgi:hypothetical protein